ncbi:hypothetical protein [Pseudidiomarina sp. CB1]|uniref:hypothetical protein n=1 Tax=Pseudidiomarina sp. CB1 TaxID=2972484 RepID=UPI002163EE12|nr:hypothetical protein [Pseudidiomarina sp. CB1]
MLAVDLPSEWLAEVWSTQATSTVWRLALAQTPRLEQLDCQTMTIKALLSWCEKDSSLWLMQQLDGVYWLTEYRRTSLSTSVVQSDWRGTRLQQFSAQGQTVAIYQNNYHPKQLERYLKLRHSGRHPIFTELSHGRFYVSLQKPSEDIFVYARTQGSLLVSARRH